MGVVRNIHYEDKERLEYSNGVLTRVRPVDQYDDLLTALEHRASEYHILKVPLLGQYTTGAKMDWCGRTSASMAYSYYKLVAGGDPAKDYVTHWNSNPSGVRDLTKPDKSIAFKDYSVISGLKEMGFYVGNEGRSDPKSSFLFEPTPSPQRAALAREIAQDPVKLEAKFARILDAFRNNNPVVFYSGFSTSDNPIHIILLVGYARIADQSGGVPQLWIAVADPSTNNGKIRTRMFTPPAPDKLVDSQDLRDLSGKDLIRITKGEDHEWQTGGGQLIFIRAAHFFDESTHGGYRLFLDYCTGKEPPSPGFFMTMPAGKRTEAPPEVVDSSLEQVQLPFGPPGSRFRPVTYLADNESSAGGFFPLGSYQNVHTGVHLTGDVSAGPAPKKPIAVRAPLAGSIVAARFSVPPEAAPDSQGDGSPKASDAARDLADKIVGNDEELVLVQHVVKILDAPGSTSGTDYTFYSLLMHLTPPQAGLWEGAGGGAGDPNVEVPWVNTVGRCHGAVVVFDPRPARAFLTEKGAGTVEEGLVPQAGAVLEVFADTKLTSASLTIAAASADVAGLAVVRSGKDTALKSALKDSKVVTFDPGVLPVAAGEVVGFFDDVSDAGRGFVHWELLAPSGAGKGLFDFLQAAAKKLQVKTDFQVFEEGDEGNLLHPADFTKLASLLPPGDQQAVGDGPPPKINYGDRPEQIAAIMRGASPLSFADLPADPPPPSYLAYPLTVSLTKGKAKHVKFPAACKVTVTFDAGDTTPKEFSCSDGAAELKVDVPALAQTMTIACDGLHTQVVKLDGQVPLLDSLASRRWRNMRLEHPNEWTKKGIKASLQAIADGKAHDLGLAAPGAPKLDDIAAAMAWWGKDTEAATGKALFGGALPEDGKLENAHPVIATWLLRLLCDQRLAQVVTSPRKTADDAKVTKFVGWVPAPVKAREVLVGEPLTAFAAAAGDAYEDVTLQLVLTPTGPGPSEVVLGSVTHHGNGLVTLPVGLPVWGTWKLGVHGESPENAGVVEVTGKKPELDVDDGCVPPPRNKGTNYTWTVTFKDNCPKKIRGCVALVTWTKKDDTCKLSKYVCPVELDQAAPVSTLYKGLTIQGGFITGARSPGTLVSPNFTYAEYSGAGSGRIALDLRDAVQNIRNAYRFSMRLSALDPSGLSVTIQGHDKAKLADAAAQVATSMAARKPSKTLTVGSPDDKGRITVSVPAPPEVEGAQPVTFEFDPSLAIEATFKDLALGADDELYLQFRLILPNGGLRGAQLMDDGRLAEVNHAVLRGSTDPDADPGDALEATAAGKPAETWAMPHFGTATVSADGKGGVIVSVPLLGGSPKLWKQVAPKITLNGNEVSSRIKGSVVTAALPHPQDPTLVVVAKATYSDVVFCGLQANVPPSDPVSVSIKHPKGKGIVVTP